MARRRASMREGPLAELFRATEAAQRQSEKEGEPGANPSAPEAPDPDATVESAAPFDQSEREAPREPAGGTPPSEDVTLAGSPPPSAPEPAPRRGRARRSRARGSRRPRAALRTWSARAPVCRSLRAAPGHAARAPADRAHPRMRTTPRPDSAAYLAVIRVVGVGGAGLNAVNRMIEAGISQVEFIAVNTDIQQLKQCEAPIKLHIGRDLTQGLGSGAGPRHRPSRRRGGRGPDQARSPWLRHGLRDRGEGGGTGSGAAPVIAQVARDMGALTVGVVTMPFSFEGDRSRVARPTGGGAGNVWTP